MTPAWKPPARALDQLPELARYQDQPAQMPAGSVGKDAYLRMGFGLRGGRTELTDLHRRAPLLVQQALHFDEAMPEMACVLMISTSGGIVQGDRYAIDIALEAGTQAHVTTQAATKVQQMDANYATMTQDICLAGGSYLELLPDPVIPYRHSRYASRTRLRVAEDATALYAEVLLPGRKHHRGEIFAYDLYCASVHGLRPDGRELFTENIVIEPGIRPVNGPGVMGGFHVLGTVVLLTPTAVAERVAPQIPVGCRTGPGDGQVATGVSWLPNDAGLIFKVLGMESEPVRGQVRALWSVVRRAVTGRDVAGFPPLGISHGRGRSTTIGRR